MDLGLEGKVVLIAESDVKYAKALALAAKREGAFVALCAPKEAAGGTAADALFSYDLSDITQAESLRDALNERFGRLDAVFFHRDEVEPAGLMQTDAAGFRRRLLPARAAFVCCKVFGGYIGSLGHGGAVVLATSLHDEKPNGADLAHSVAQGMTENLAMEAALEYGEAGVRVNQIAMGAMEGDEIRFKSQITSFYEGNLYKVPGGRLGTAEDLAALALFLLSGRATFANGARVRLDGGLTLHYVDPKANYKACRACGEVQ
jgi:glucose 1-dehydrogenase